MDVDRLILFSSCASSPHNLDCNRPSSNSGGLCSVSVHLQLILVGDNIDVLYFLCQMFWLCLLYSVSHILGIVYHIQPHTLLPLLFSLLRAPTVTSGC